MISMKTTANFFSVLSAILIACAGFAGCEQIHRGIDGPVVIVPGGEEEKPPEDNYTTNDAMDHMWETVQSSTTGIGSRDFCEFLVEAAAKNWPQDRLKTTLLKVSSLQIRNQNSPYYGNFLWRTGDTAPMAQTSSFDINGALFCGTMLTLLRFSYYDKLDADNKALLDDIIPLLITAVTRDVHDRRASYTNTWTMRIWILCGLGEVLGDNDALNEGKASLREWMRDIYTNGIVEFNSGIYAQVSARALGCLANLSQDDEIKREAGIGLRYFSRLQAGNLVSYDDIGMVYGGPQSRNYNFAHGRAEPDMFHGMFTGRPQGFYDSHAAWTLSAEDRALHQLKNRTLVYRYGSQEERFVVHHVGSQFSMGSLGRPYGNEDKSHVITLFDTDRPAVVHISSVVEGQNDPYGENRSISRRPWHFMRYLNARAHRTIESGSEMVFLLSANDDQDTRGYANEVNHFTVIPKVAHDGLWDGNSPLDVSGWADNYSQVLSPAGNYTLFIRFGDAAVGIRYLKVFDTQGNDVLSQVKIVNRPYSTLFNYTRLDTPMVIHAKLADSKPGSSECAAVAAWWRVKEGLNDAEFAAFRSEMINASVQFEQTTSNSVVTGYTVKVETPDGVLGVRGNNFNASSYRNQQRESFGANVLTLAPGANFMVNGIDIAPSLFAGSTYAGN